MFPYIIQDANGSIKLQIKKKRKGRGKVIKKNNFLYSLKKFSHTLIC